ncbi:MAG: ATP-binding protein [Lachnospiraceae bacterium]|nr:ATP-binding protein [Lachnospiraceae bacterium]
MGIYLNGISAFELFRDESEATFFIDKSDIFKELVPIVESKKIKPDEKGKNLKYVCITRPRRFGKTVMANMITSYFSKGVDSKKVFDELSVSKQPWYESHLNKHNVIHIMFNETPDDCRSYAEYINRIRNILVKDLSKAYPEAGLDPSEALWDILREIYEYSQGERFVFVLDEWDFIFHQDYVTEDDKKKFTVFLSNLLKDKAYLEMVYMTGILPIAKYSSGSELNMFCEYTMVSEERYSESFGFTESEVDRLYQRFTKLNEKNRKVSREGLKEWYDGYHTKNGERVYNPRSVVLALENNNMGNYWTSSGPYDELFYYIGANVDEVKTDVAKLISGIPVKANVCEYAATSLELKTRDEIFSAMVVYGFLNYENGYVSIPNRELMEKFSQMAERESSLGNVYRLVSVSEKMLMATRNGDTKMMEDILQYTHDTESPLLFYNNEEELSSIINLVYLKARDYYRIEREDKAGIGYVDYIFYPYNKSDDCIIIELKVDHTADEAIQQIKDKKYSLRFEGKIGENPEYTGRIIAAGIAYSKKDPKKKHECKVVRLR